jgi:hypothetical protein
MSRLSERRELFPPKDYDVGYYNPKFEVARSKSCVGGKRYLVPIIRPSKSVSQSEISETFGMDRVERGFDLIIPRNKVPTPDLSKTTGRDDLMYKVTEAYKPCIPLCVGEIAMSCSNCLKKKKYDQIACHLHGRVEKCIEEIENGVTIG